MSIRKAGIVLPLVVFLLAGVGWIVGGTIGYRLQLPDPQACDRDGILRWIATRDLSAEQPELRKSLVRRLEEEFGQGQIDWTATGAKLKPAYKERLRGNLPVLVQPWLEMKVQQYTGLTDRERPAFLDRTVDLLGQWRKAQAICGDDGKSPSTAADSWLGKIEHWRDTAEPKERQQIQEFLGALQGRWIQRTLFGWPSTAKLPERAA